MKALCDYKDRIRKSSIWVFIFIATSSTFWSLGCSNKDSSVGTATDGVSPIPGDSGTISITSVTSTGLTLGWTTASDSTNSAETLSYLPYYSTTNNISTISDAEANGVAFGSFESNISSKSITGLNASTTYYFNVIVKDPNNNKSIYSTNNATTNSCDTSSIGGGLQGCTLNLTFNVSTLVTSTSGLDQPNQITTDGVNLYFTDFNNHLIRKVVISTGAMTTLAGTGGTGSADGTGTAASFNYPTGLTLLGGHLYVVDSDNHTIRKINVSTGVVTIFAGTNGTQGDTDGIGTAASFNGPSQITHDGTHLYVTDTGNNTIRKIVVSSGTVTTIAGSSAAAAQVQDGTGTSALFDEPWGIASDGSNLYISDSTGNTIRKMVLSTGVVSTIAGTASTSGSTDGAGTVALFNAPRGMTTDGINLYITDRMNSTIRKLAISTNIVSTIAGSAGVEAANNGAGTVARFYRPVGITNDGSALYVADTRNNSIRKIE